MWCESGLYASRKIVDALSYSPYNTAYICRVTCEDIEREDNHKFVCRRRRIDWRVPADPVLREFARKCALSVIHLWDAPDIVKQYLETGDETLRIAARDAARDAVWAAARGTISGAAKDAAWDAAWTTAWNAARYASMDTARVAARAAASESQNNVFEKLVKSKKENR